VPLRGDRYAAITSMKTVAAIKYLRQKSIVILTITALTASMAIGYRPNDWSRFDHRSFRVIEIVDGDKLRVELSNGKSDVVRLLGAAGTDAAKPWLATRTMGKRITLLLQSPQTRDPSGELRAFVFLDNQSLNLDLVKAGLAYADRREKTDMDGVLNPAEADARKKKRGIWAIIKFEQTPAWRQVWVKSLPRASRN
jgi:endonuclease YncB( thermonuclease family)